jgi:hypothetical protein
MSTGRNHSAVPLYTLVRALPGKLLEKLHPAPQKSLQTVAIMIWCLPTKKPSHLKWLIYIPVAQMTPYYITINLLQWQKLYLWNISRQLNMADCSAKSAEEVDSTMAESSPTNVNMCMIMPTVDYDNSTYWHGYIVTLSKTKVGFMISIELAFNDSPLLEDYDISYARHLRHKDNTMSCAEDYKW